MNNIIPSYNFRPSAESIVGTVVLWLRWKTCLFAPLDGKAIWKMVGIVALRVLAALAVALAASSAAILTAFFVIGYSLMKLNPCNLIACQWIGYILTVFRSMAMPLGYLPKVNFCRDSDGLMLFCRDSVGLIINNNRYFDLLDGLDDRVDFNQFDALDKDTASFILSRPFLLEKLLRIGLNPLQPCIQLDGKTISFSEYALDWWMLETKTFLKLVDFVYATPTETILVSVMFRNYVVRNICGFDWKKVTLACIEKGADFFEKDLLQASEEINQLNADTKDKQILAIIDCAEAWILKHQASQNAFLMRFRALFGHVPSIAIPYVHERMQEVIKFLPEMKKARCAYINKTLTSFDDFKNALKMWGGSQNLHAQSKIISEFL